MAVVYPFFMSKIMKELDFEIAVDGVHINNFGYLGGMFITELHNKHLGRDFRWRSGEQGDIDYIEGMYTCEIPMNYLFSRYWFESQKNVLEMINQLIDKGAIRVRQYGDSILVSSYMINNEPTEEIKNSQKSDKPKTYLMKDSNTGYTKIGKSKDPKFRERTLQSEKPTIELFAVCEKDIEQKLHENLSEYRIRGEWFDLPDDIIIQIILSEGFTKKD